MKLSTAFFLVMIFSTGMSCNKTMTSLTLESIDKEVVSIGDSFDLKIEALDTDGIESVSIDIQSIGYYELFDRILDRKWNIIKTIQIDSIVSIGTAEIIVVLKNQVGEETSSSVYFEIE